MPKNVAAGRRSRHRACSYSAAILESSYEILLLVGQKGQIITS
jgi:hypothetical protein